MPQTLTELIEYIDKINIDINELVNFTNKDKVKLLNNITNILERIDVASRLIENNTLNMDISNIYNTMGEIVTSVENEDYRYVNALLVNEAYVILNNWRHQLSKMI